MRKLLLVLGGLLAVAAATLTPTPVTAGGWAVVSFDPLPELVAGESATITFTVLQHGVHPVAGDELGGPGLALRVTGPDATVSAPATATDVVGQFAATIVVPPDVREIDLAVEWTNGLALQEAAITVPVAAPPSGGVEWVPLGFGAVAVLGLAVVASSLGSRDTTETGGIAGRKRDPHADDAVSVTA